MPSQDAGVLRNLTFPAPIIQLQERQPVLAAEGIPRPNYLRAHVGARELRGQRRRRDGSFWELTAFGPAPAALWYLGVVDCCKDQSAIIVVQALKFCHVLFTNHLEQRQEIPLEPL